MASFKCVSPVSSHCPTEESKAAHMRGTPLFYVIFNDRLTFLFFYHDGAYTYSKISFKIIIRTSFKGINANLPI